VQAARDVKLETARLVLRQPVLAGFKAWALMEADKYWKPNTGSVQRESWN
jgi:hypothetical protein